MCADILCQDITEGPGIILGISIAKRVRDGRWKDTYHWRCCEQVGVDVMLEAPLERLFAKSRALGVWFVILVEQECSR